MAADAYVTKYLKMKLKKELLSLGWSLGIPLRKSWTKGRLVESIAGRYEENPEILLHTLSRESADFLRKHLRSPAHQIRMKASVYIQLEFLGLVENGKNAVEKKKDPVDKSSCLEEKREGSGEEHPESLFEGSRVKAFLLKNKQAGLIRRLDEMESIVRGMLRCFGLLEDSDLVDMAAKTCLERYGSSSHTKLSGFEDLRKEMESLLRYRLGLRTYEEGKRTYLLHPSVIDPERLHYIILASPVETYREFTFQELVHLGEGEETSGEVYLGLLDLLGKHPFKEEAKTDGNPGEDELSGERPNGERPSGERSVKKPLKLEMRQRKDWEADILQIKLRIREGAPNLEIVREVMERLYFEDHQEVSHFLGRFISHCDDIPRWNLKGFRMNEI